MDTERVIGIRDPSRLPAARPWPPAGRADNGAPRTIARGRVRGDGRAPVASRLRGARGGSRLGQAPAWLGARVGDRGARRARRRFVRDVEPGEMVVLGEESAATLGPLRGGSRASVRLRADLLRAARLVHAGPQPVRGTSPHGRAVGRRGAGGRGPGDAGAGHGRAGGGRLCGAKRHPVSRGDGQEPLRRADVHPAAPGDAPARRAR